MAIGWLRRHDPSYAALRRAGRAAILMPAVFAFSDKVIGAPAVTLFAALGSFGMLLLVDFAGSPADRIRAQASLGVACVVLIALGTLVSRSTPVAVIVMAVVAFGVLFAGVVSSVLAGASTTMLLSYIVAVTSAAPTSQIPDRIAGWALASAVSVVAITVLWPAPSVNPVRQLAVAACRALAARLRAEIDWVRSADAPSDRDHYEAAVARSTAAVEALQSRFFATPYRPTGLATDARAVIRLVDELRWLDRLVLRSAAVQHPASPNPAVCAVKLTAADVLERASDELDAPHQPPEPLEAARDRLRSALNELERETTTRPLVGTPAGSAGPTTSDLERVVTALDPSFRAQELSFIIAQIATNIEFAAAAARRSWIDRLLGRQPPGFTGAFASVRERALAYAAPNSSWLHNSIRGAIGLSLAVLVADVTTVQHGFWVVFGTLGVLRSNALATGQNVLRGLLGTTVGFVVGGVIVYLVGTTTAVLWALLPFAVLLAGLAPATISFEAGQAAFTLTLLILFNLLVPAGWRLGLIRVEDVAIGGAVSLAVGLLFWPRGAGPALGRALAQAYEDSSRYLAGAVAFVVGCCDGTGPQAAPPRGQAAQAAASARRLDDTFRGFLAERGAKQISLADVTSLLAGVAGVRLAADAVLDLWDDDGASGGDRAAARRELLASADQMNGWFQRFAASLDRRGPVPEPVAADPVAELRLVDAVDHDLRDGDGRATATGVRVIWTGDHLDAVRRLQTMLVEPAHGALGAAGGAPGPAGG